MMLLMMRMMIEEPEVGRKSGGWQTGENFFVEVTHQKWKIMRWRYGQRHSIIVGIASRDISGQSIG